MIKIHILAPHDGGREENSQDYSKGVWRVYFEDPDFPDNKNAYITNMDLKFKHKMNPLDIENTRNYLESWAKEYLKGKEFIAIENEFKI